MPSSAQLKNEWRHSSTLAICLQGEYRNYFTFINSFAIPLPASARLFLPYPYLRSNYDARNVNSTKVHATKHLYALTLQGKLILRLCSVKE